MTVFFVSRHSGAKQWALRHGFQVDRMVAHLDPEDVQPGDAVIGSLPVNLAARVCDRGGVYHHLTLELPMGWRGRELTSEEMEAFGARLETYYIEAIA